MDNTTYQCEICPSRHLSLFRDLKPHLVEMLDRSKRASFYRRGQIIFHEDNPVFGLYCINSGKVKVYKTTPAGNVQILRIANPGETLGSRSLFANESYSTTAEVVEDAVLCFIDRKTFFPLISESNDMSWLIIQSLAQELIRSESQTTEMAYSSVRERIAAMLLLLKEKHGKSHDEGILLDICLSREELANLVGTSTETAVRILSEFRKEGLIETKEKRLVILTPGNLAQIAGFQD